MGLGIMIYTGNVYCEACGIAIRQKLTAEGKAPADVANEFSYESTDFPKGPYEELFSRRPCHCVECKQFLQNPLTEDGWEFVRAMVAENNAKGRISTAIIQWENFYLKEQKDEPEQPAPPVQPGPVHDGDG